jgi:hypothetical protein
MNNNLYQNSLRTAIASNYINKHLNSSAIIQANRVMKFSRLAKKSFEKFKSGYDNFKYLVQRDWYISTKVLDKLELNRISELFEFTNKSNLDEFESYVLASFDDRKDVVFRYLSNTFESRKHIFDEIHKMYDLQLYYGIIALCYSQADGISNETWGIGFFDTEEKKLNYELKIKKLNTSKKQFSKAIINQISQPKNELNRYSKDAKYQIKENKENSINRHLVIHGHSKFHGNRKNAIRAILLLEFICDLVNEDYTVQ